MVGATVAEVPVQARDGSAARPPLDQIWDWLAQVPDPEIPVISVVDLGIVRGLDWVGDRLEVAVTPTYSGCPATAVIALDIETALHDRGLSDVTVKTQLSPPWSTDWMTSEGRAKLKAYGIAPPTVAGPQDCPRCGSHDLERISQFGSTPCKALWRCRDCLEPFDYFKCL